MSDTLRIALKGSGKVRVSIQQGNNKDFFLEAIEDWARLTKTGRAVIKAGEMAAAEDPDGLIWETLKTLVQDCHINREVRERVAALVPTPNDPLTRDQLLEMDGEPVWIVFLPDEDGKCITMWALVSVDKDDEEIYLMNGFGGSSAYEEVRGDIKAIYRRKPEWEI